MRSYKRTYIYVYIFFDTIEGGKNFSFVCRCVCASYSPSSSSCSGPLIEPLLERFMFNVPPPSLQMTQFSEL